MTTMQLKRSFLVLALLLLGGFVLSISPKNVDAQTSSTQPWWEFQAVDTMKYSRDAAREKVNDTEFRKEIDIMVKEIADTGATHIAIATPYDSEFLPFLKQWVNDARKYNLKVWFRGNWSGWEGWFGYPKITREEHISKTNYFILNNANLFEDGDIFTGCPECENGGPGDPRHNGDAEGHRKFLIDEYKITKSAFDKIKKDVKSNFNSMNGDVARLIMDKKTTAALDGIVTVDHYVKYPEVLAKDVVDLAKNSGGRVVLGEFGAPIPDINGKQTEEQQAQWIDSALSKLAELPELIGLSYWTNKGSSTQLWDDSGKARKAVQVLTSYYKPKLIVGSIKDELGKPVKYTKVQILDKTFIADEKGAFTAYYLKNPVTVTVSVDGYKTQKLILAEHSSTLDIVLVKEHEGFLFKIQKAIQNLLRLLKPTK